MASKIYFYPLRKIIAILLKIVVFKSNKMHIVAKKNQFVEKI